MSSIFSNISSALSQRLNNLSGLPAVSWENYSIKPKEGETYLRETLLPGSTTTFTLGQSGLDNHVGIYQIDVFSPAEKGKKTAIDYADKIADHFKRGTNLTYGAVTVTVKNVSRKSGSRDGAFYIIPVEVNYFAFTQPR